MYLKQKDSERMSEGMPGKLKQKERSTAILSMDKVNSMTN